MTTQSVRSQLIWGREPAAYVALIQAGVAAVVMLGIGLSVQQGGAIVGLVNAGLGLFLAWRVRPIAPAVMTAFIQAALGFLVGFGLHLTEVQQGVLLTLASVLVTFIIVRPQVSPVGSVATQNAQSVG